MQFKQRVENYRLRTYTELLSLGWRDDSGDYYESGSREWSLECPNNRNSFHTGMVALYNRLTTDKKHRLAVATKQLSGWSFLALDNRHQWHPDLFTQTKKPKIRRVSK